MKWHLLLAFWAALFTVVTGWVGWLAVLVTAAVLAMCWEMGRE